MTTSKTTAKKTSKTAKKAPGSRKGAGTAQGAKDAKPTGKRAHGATPARTAAPTAKTGITLPELADAYLAHLEEVGKSPATVFSYRMDLTLARKHFGADTPATSLTPEQVAGFFECDAVNKRKSGTPKTEITVKKTQRVLRLALVWAAEQKMIPAAPLPTVTADKD